MFLLDIIRNLENQKVPYIVVGGYALALHGIVRATVDVDLIISLQEAHLKAAEEVLMNLGLNSRVPVNSDDIAQFHEEFRAKRTLIAWSFVDNKNPTRQVNLLIHPPLKTVKSEIISVHGHRIKVATKSALLKMKQISNRPEDQLDIQRLKEAINNEEK